MTTECSPPCVLEKIHAMIHDASFALANGNTEEVRRLHREIDVMTHDEIAKES